MIKETIVFVGAFALSAALGATGAGCSSDDCNCQTIPDRPPEQSGLRITSVVTDTDAATTIRPYGGTLASTGDTIVIRYDENGVMHEVVYAIDRKWP